MDELTILSELFNRGLNRAPDDTNSLVDESTVYPRTITIGDAARRMAEYLDRQGLEIQRKE